MIVILKKIWSGWKKIAYAIGTANAYIMLTIFYFVVIGITNILRRASKMFKPQKKTGSSYWINYQSPSGQDFKRQF